ncbi:Fic family protein [Flavobacterium hiemivividum]|uniref:Helix-turn-helix domain-containing protein n=1 Tax=Flavobacterium hiemivividum TaxID=2541734 RepID=A0A4R5CZZ2_9FLAO|nr:Fic family protein [Flavobacterium hiemivividum]TDE05487.1 helix-turn-helix domain-containing protein [Flavobacterium hiemivividum]
MKTLLKEARELKNFKTREVAQLLGIDQALISKFESGTRKPTKDQVSKLAALLDIDYETIIISWLKEKIIHEIGNDEFALKALRAAEEEIRLNSSSTAKKVSTVLQQLLDEIDSFKAKLNLSKQIKNNSFTEALEIEYTYNTNSLEGNTLSLNETELVVNEGQTISGKSMREHLEAINHQEAIAFIKNKVESNTIFTEKELLSIHAIILRGILPKEAGHYRAVSITIKDRSFTPCEPASIPRELEALFNWYEMNKNLIHPIILAATIKQRILTIHPFINGNGKVSRLIMNFVLLQHGYLIANIKAENESRNRYFQSLKESISKENNDAFTLYLAQIEKESLENNIRTISQ